MSDFCCLRQSLSVAIKTRPLFFWVCCLLLDNTVLHTGLLEKGGSGHSTIWDKIASFGTTLSFEPPYLPQGWALYLSFHSVLHLDVPPNVIVPTQLTKAPLSVQFLSAERQKHTCRLGTRSRHRNFDVFQPPLSGVTDSTTT